MNGYSVAHRCAAGVLIGLALFGLAAHAELLLTGTFHAIAWGITLIVGVVAARAPRAVAPDGGTPRWLVATSVAIAIATTLVVAWGALATPARHWDGAVAWELRADFLTHAPTIAQPFFADSRVYSPSPDYPLLQPLAIAAGNALWGGGRVLFPILFAALLAAVYAGSRFLATRGLAHAAMTAVAVTPMLVGTSGGAADSGYADVLVATAVAGTALALSIRDARLLAAAVAVLVWAKPEGLFYGALPIAIAWCAGERGLLHASLAGWSIATALWLPVQQRLLHATDVSWWLALCPLAVAALVALGDHCLRRDSARSRMVVIAAILPLAVLGLAAASALQGDTAGTMQRYLGDAARPLARLTELPTIAAGYLDRAVVRGRFGLGFAILAAIAITGAVRRRTPRAPWLVSLLALGLATTVLPFLWSPEDDLPHLIRSSMARLLLHWIGPLWMVIALAADQAPTDMAHSRHSG